MALLTMAVALSAAVLTVTAAAAPLTSPKDDAVAASNCHNITGTCLPHGYVCLSGQVVRHAQRCDGIEDCGDGTDEYMCDHPERRPLHTLPAEQRQAFAQSSSCIGCQCEVSTVTVLYSDSWYAHSIVAPLDTVGLMTGGGTYGGKPCSNQCTKSLLVAVYKKAGICRGWICCIRQRRCLTCIDSGYLNTCVGNTAFGGVYTVPDSSYNGRCYPGT